MDSQHSESYIAHAIATLDSVQSMRSDEIIFDVELKVGNESFRAHRVILAAHSDYFRAMFLHATKESREGVVEMKAVQPVAIKLCIEFMYTGEFVLTLETVEDVLCAADMLQLDKVKDLAFGYLSENLDDNNCFFVLKLVKLYPCEKLQNEAKCHIRSHFMTIIESDGYKYLSFCDVEECVIECSNGDDELWGGALSWIEHDDARRGDHILHFMKLLKLEAFPSARLLASMWGSPSFHRCFECKDILLRRLFSDISDLKTSITSSTCFSLKLLAESYEHITKEAKDAIANFMKLNLDQVMVKEEFLTLPKKDVLALFRADNAEYLTSETFKWNQLVKWMKKNESEKDIFPELFKTIKFDFLPRDFILSTVRNETLVKQFEECREAIVDILANYRQTLEKYIVVLRYDNSMFEINPLMNTPSKICSPEINRAGHVLRCLVNLNGNVCFLQGRLLFHLTNAGVWVMKATLLRSPSVQAKAVEFLGCLYLVDTNKIFKYDPRFNSWTESLAGCGFDEFSVASSKMYIYAMKKSSSTRFSCSHCVVRYDPALQSWSQYCSGAGLAMASPNVFLIDSMLYAFNGQKVMYYDKENVNWKERFFAESYSVSSTTFRFGDRLACFNNELVSMFLSSSSTCNELHKRSSLRMYDPSCNGFALVPCSVYDNVISLCVIQKCKNRCGHSLKRPRLDI